MQLKYHMITIEDLVPKDHLLRKVEAMLDLSFVYEETAHLYNRKYGRPAINPVILVKYLLLGYLYPESAGLEAHPPQCRTTAPHSSPPPKR